MTPLVDGVLLDVDDTLVDTRGAWRHAMAAVADRYLAPVPDRAARIEAMVVLWRADPGGHYRRYTRGELTAAAQRHRRADELHAAFGGPVLDDAGFAAWDEVFDAGFRAGWVAHPEVVGVLDTLIARRVPLGALTNATVDYQTVKLAQTGLATRVPLLVGTDTLGVGKPDPRVFAEACRRLGTDPARTAYVGDELDIDAVAARDAGLVGVWLDRPGGRRVPVSDAEIEAAQVLVVHDLVKVPLVLGLGA